MKRTLQNSMRSRCGFACHVVGLLVLLAGTVAAQPYAPLPGQKNPTVAPATQAATDSKTTSNDDLPGTGPSANTYSSPAAAEQQIFFSIELVVAGEPTLQGWFQQHSKESVRQFAGSIDTVSPITLPAEARLSLLTQLNRDAESSILRSPTLVTRWGRTVSY
ncbi:MAG: hypothetical protein ACI93T_002936, partial [Porticoccaceae bacterium]